MTISDLLQKHQNGTYASMLLSAQSAQQLADWLDQRGIPHDQPQEFHCTLCYSRTPVPQAVAMNGPVNITARAAEWAHLGDNATVLLLDCERAHGIFQLLGKHGASHDWPQYDPHLTVFKDSHIELPNQLPDFPLVFNRIIAQPLDD